MRNCSKTFQTFPFFLYKINLKIWIFSLSNSKRTFGGYFQWNACTYLQNICRWTKYSDAELIKIFQTFWSHSSVFVLQKQPKNLSFHIFFTSRSPISGYFQWNTCTYFLRICRWTTYSVAKFIIKIKNISKFLVSLLRFCFRETT